MRQIKKRAHQYAVAHEHNGNGVSLMRAYTVGALDERKQTKVFISGKISGLEYYVAYGKFSNAERKPANLQAFFMLELVCCYISQRLFCPRVEC